MNNRRTIILFLCLASLAGCEQERIDDTRDLHPYSGDEPVIFAFLGLDSRIVDIEAQRTLPYYSQEASAELENLSGTLMTDGAIAGEIVPLEAGNYQVELKESLNAGSACYLSFEHPVFGSFRTSEVFVPEPVAISAVDTTRIDGSIILTGTFGSLPPNLSVSSKLIRFGEGIILGGESAASLPIRSARQALTEDMRLTDEYTVRNQFTVFDPDLRIPIDTVLVDSVQLILYTWGEEVIRFTTTVNGTSQDFGDGAESIDNTSWSNIEGGHGLIAGFASDTVTVILR